MSYAYDALNRVVRGCENVSDGACAGQSNPLVRVEYDALSRRTELRYRNGAVTGYDYSQRGDLETHAHDLPGTANDVDWQLAYNGTGQLVSKLVSDAALRFPAPALGALANTDAMSYSAAALSQ